MLRRRTMVSDLEYREAGQNAPGRLHLVQMGSQREERNALDELRREMERAAESAVAEVEARMRREFAVERDAMTRQMGDAIQRFQEERSRYFADVEREVVGLALGIARKILQREAELDPTLLAALVRIALERMEAASNVRVRVPQPEVGHWKAIAQADWEVMGDGMLSPGDCVVETEMGRANFGFEAQLLDVEETLQRLMSQRTGTA